MQVRTAPTGSSQRQDVRSNATGRGEQSHEAFLERCCHCCGSGDRAAPALAQAQTSGSQPAGTAAAPAAGPATAHQAARARPHRPTHARRPPRRRVASYGRSAGASPGDNVANQLNQQELQRLDASSAPAAMPMPPRPVARPQPGLSTNSGTYIPPSPGGPVSNARRCRRGAEDERRRLHPGTDRADADAARAAGRGSAQRSLNRSSSVALPIARGPRPPRSRSSTSAGASAMTSRRG